MAAFRGVNRFSFYATFLAQLEAAISMSYETLTVNLKNGKTHYFPAGAVIGDSSARLDLLREAIETSSDFRSLDSDGYEQVFNGADVERYTMH